jgi:hypothetical protein
MAGFGGKAKVADYTDMLLAISKRKVIPVEIKEDKINI